MATKPVLLTMSNPLSCNPDNALLPAPKESAGWHLWKMLNARTGATPEDYCRAFERRNLMSRKKWTQAEVRWAAADFVHEMCGRQVLVVGREAINAVGLAAAALFHPCEQRGVIWRTIPGPSYDNPWYRLAGNIEAVEMLLEELYAPARRRAKCAA